MTDNELLLAISDMLDKKLDSKINPLGNRLKRIEIAIENDVLPRLQTIEECYTSTYNRYKDNIESYDEIKDEIKLLKTVVREHSGKLEKLA